MNHTGIPPLFEPRGLPPNLSSAVRDWAAAWGEVGEFGNGWLTLAEVRAALAHHRIDPDHLSFETGTILSLMADLERRAGVGRVRLVLGFWG